MFSSTHRKQKTLFVNSDRTTYETLANNTCLLSPRLYPLAVIREWGSDPFQPQILKREVSSTTSRLCHGSDFNLLALKST